MYPLDPYILKAVEANQRQMRCGVLPRHVQPQLPVRLSEQRVRLYMVRLWSEGKLVRVGGNGARRGYRVLTGQDQNKIVVLRQTIAERQVVTRNEIEPSAIILLDAMRQRGEVVPESNGWRLPNVVERVAFEMTGYFPFGVAS